MKQTLKQARALMAGAVILMAGCSSENPMVPAADGNAASSTEGLAMSRDDSRTYEQTAVTPDDSPRIYADDRVSLKGDDSRTYEQTAVTPEDSPRIYADHSLSLQGDGSIAFEQTAVTPDDSPRIYADHSLSLE